MRAEKPVPIGQRDSVSWAIVDLELEVRSRIACIVDELDLNEPETALINALWLLEDLDAVAGSVR